MQFSYSHKQTQKSENTIFSRSWGKCHNRQCSHITPPTTLNDTGIHVALLFAQLDKSHRYQFWRYYWCISALSDCMANDELYSMDTRHIPIFHVPLAERNCIDIICRFASVWIHIEDSIDGRQKHIYYSIYEGEMRAEILAIARPVCQIVMVEMASNAILIKQNIKYDEQKQDFWQREKKTQFSFDSCWFRHGIKMEFLL